MKASLFLREGVALLKHIEQAFTLYYKKTDLRGVDRE
jgi:hypothetical protein